MKKTSEITALVVDCGLFCELAAKLAQTYAKVYYHVPWQTAFPTINNAMIGYGMEGVNLVDSIFGDHFDEIDVFVFPDVHFGPEQTYLESIGKKVWGSRMASELELDRVVTKEWLKRRDAPVGPYVVVKGMDALREHLKTHKNQYVKIDKWRGTLDTFRSKDYKSIEPKLDAIEHDLGPFKYVIDFIVEDDLPDKFEIGTDAYFVDGMQPSKLLTGIEIKDLGYVGVFTQYDKIPKPITAFNELIAPRMKRYGYRGFFSHETRIGKDQKPYMIDACCRAASPPNELYQEFYLNLADIIWQGANGVMVDPKPVAKYGAELVIHSTWAEKEWQPIQFPEKLKPRIKLHNCMKVKDRWYVAPQSVEMVEIGAVIGWGGTMDAAIEDVNLAAEEISGYFLELNMEWADKGKEKIAQMNEFGLNLF